MYALEICLCRFCVWFICSFSVTVTNAWTFCQIWLLLLFIMYNYYYWRLLSYYWGCLEIILICLFV